MQVPTPEYSIAGGERSDPEMDMDTYGSGQIALADLVSLYHVLESASAAVVRGRALNFDKAGMLSTLIREEQAFVETRLRDVAEEIRRAPANNLSDRIQKLRFHLIASGDDEIAAEAAIAEFCDASPEYPQVTTDEARDCLDRICDELCLAEAAISLMCRADPKFDGVRILIERAVLRLSALNAD